MQEGIQLPSCPDSDTQSNLDRLNKLEKIGLLPSAKAWIEMREIRNSITHEYPDNEEDMINGIKEALQYFPEIENIVTNLENYIKILNEK